MTHDILQDLPCQSQSPPAVHTALCICMDDQGFDGLRRRKQAEYDNDNIVPFMALQYECTPLPNPFGWSALFSSRLHTQLLDQA